MALVTTAEVKTYLGITSTEYDNTIAAFLPAVIDEFFQYTNNYFKSDRARFSGELTITSTGTIAMDSNTWDDYYFASADEIYVHGSVRNDGFYTATTISSATITVSTADTLASEDEDVLTQVWKIELPRSAKPVIAQMIKFKMDNPSGIVKSERLGDYSVEYGNINGGYPAGIVGALNKFRCVKFV